MYTVDQLEDKLFELAFAEDIGDGDHTTLCCIPPEAMGKSKLLVKESGILAGVDIARKIFSDIYPTRKFRYGKYYLRPVLSQVHEKSPDPDGRHTFDSVRK